MSPFEPLQRLHRDDALKPIRCSSDARLTHDFTRGFCGFAGHGLVYSGKATIDVLSENFDDLGVGLTLGYHDHQYWTLAFGWSRRGSGITGDLEIDAS